jgi:hypothetical protein
VKETMRAPYLIRGLLISALCLASQATALATPCGDAARNYNRISTSNDDWYLRAYERATGISASAKVTLAVCPVALPIFRERLRRQRAILSTYRAYQSACANPRINVGERDGLKTLPAPAVMQSIMSQVQECEQALAKNHVHVGAGSRTCTNQLGRCISYRRVYGPTGSEAVCSRVFRTCLASGVWDATSAFPYGGARITDMIRQ